METLLTPTKLQPISTSKLLARFLSVVGCSIVVLDECRFVAAIFRSNELKFIPQAVEFSDDKPVGAYSAQLCGHFAI